MIELKNSEDQSLSFNVDPHKGGRLLIKTNKDDPQLIVYLSPQEIRRFQMSLEKAICTQYLSLPFGTITFLGCFIRKDKVELHLVDKRYKHNIQHRLYFSIEALRKFYEQFIKLIS